MERRANQYVSPACFGIYHAALGQADGMYEFLQVPWANAILTSPAWTQSPILTLSAPTRVIVTY
jgi:hypothetical protein